MMNQLSLAAKLSAVFLLLISGVAVLAPWVAPYSYATQDTLSTLAFPSLEHWIGVDMYGIWLSLVPGVLSPGSSKVLQQ